MSNLPLNIDVQQILLHMFNFLILFGCLYFILYKPVKDFMEKRNELYAQTDEKINKRLEDAEKTKSDYEEKLLGADKEISAIKAKAEAESRVSAEAIIDSAKAEASDIINKARAQAKAEYDEKMRNANTEISGLVVAATKKIVFKDTDSAFNSFLDSLEEEQNGEEE